MHYAARITLYDLSWKTALPWVIISRMWNKNRFKMYVWFYLIVVNVTDVFKTIIIIILFDQYSSKFTILKKILRIAGQICFPCDQ